MKHRILLGLLLLLGIVSPAFAQVNYVPQVGTLSAILKNPTYSAVSVGLVPASAATDIFCISAGSSRNISIKQITVGGTAGTAITTPFLIYERSALGTSGTAATGIALPVAVPLNPSDPASTAVLTAYTGNPTVAATPLLMDAILADLPVTTAGGGVINYELNYGTTYDVFDKSIDILKGTTVQVCVNLNGVTVSSGVLVISMLWQETN